jgi:hypothetical protein
MEIDNVEIARRIGAAMAYAEIGKRNGQVREELCATLGVSARTLDRMLGKGVQTPRHTPWEELRVIAEYCGLPPEWFSADLSRLHLIVPEGGVVVVRSRRQAEPTTVERAADAALRARETLATSRRAHAATDTDQSGQHEKGSRGKDATGAP